MKQVLLLLFFSPWINHWNVIFDILLSSQNLFIHQNLDTLLFALLLGWITSIIVSFWFFFFHSVPRYSLPEFCLPVSFPGYLLRVIYTPALDLCWSICAVGYASVFINILRHCPCRHACRPLVVSVCVSVMLIIKAKAEEAAAYHVHCQRCFSSDCSK